MTFQRTRALRKTSLRRTLLVSLLGSASLLPTLPAWADPPAAVNEAAPPAAADPAPPAPGPVKEQTKDAVKNDARVNITVEPRDADMQARRQALLEEQKVRMDDRKAFREARLAGLHAGLQLTAAQQSLWPAVETALRDVAQARDALRDLSRRGDMRGPDMRGPDMRGPGPRGPDMGGAATRGSADADKNPIARLKQRGERLVAMGQAVGKLADAAGPLLGALTSQQKDRLPVLLRGVGPRRLVGEAFGLDPMRRPDGGRFGMGEGRRRGGRDGGMGDRFADRMGADRMGADRVGADRVGDGRFDRDGRGDGWSRHRRFERDDRAGRDDPFEPPGKDRDERSGG